MTTDVDYRRQACLVLAAVYPTRRERTVPVGDVADQWRARSQRHRGERAHQGGQLPDRRRWTR